MSQKGKYFIHIRPGSPSSANNYNKFQKAYEDPSKTTIVDYFPGLDGGTFRVTVFPFPDNSNQMGDRMWKEMKPLLIDQEKPEYEHMNV